MQPKLPDPSRPGERPGWRLDEAGRSWPWFLICAASTLLKLWLVSAQTIHAIAPSGADDQLFLSLATSLLHGDWLGPLTDFTLVKGPVYPLWIALNQRSGLPLLLSQAVLYVFSCAVLARAIRSTVGAPSRRALVYLAVLFNPATWAEGPATRVIREGIYPSLTLLLLALAIGAALRLRVSPRLSTVWAAAAGVVGALLMMTREEGIWVLPSLVIIALAPFARGKPRPWRPWVGAAAAAALAFACPTLAIAGMNLRRYGLFETCEARTGYFTSAYGSLTRVRTTTWNPRVPVPLQARASIFAISPAFREIANHLETDAPNWTVESCKAVGVCDDIAGGWFMWALRAAVASAGEYRDGPHARAWYERLTRDIDEACRSGRLDCLPPRSSLMPPWRAEYLVPVAAGIGRAAIFTATFAEVTPRSSLPQGDETDFVEFERMTNERLPRSIFSLRGVVTSRAGEVVAGVVDHLGETVKASIRRGVAIPITTRPDENKRSIPFSVSASCNEDCALLLFASDGRSLVVPLSEKQFVRGDPALTWRTDSATMKPLAPAERSREARLEILTALTRAYAWTLPCLSLLALVLLGSRLVGAARARASSVLQLVQVALLVGVGVRLVLLALVDATSFPAVNVLYLSPVYPLIIAFVALTLAGGSDHGDSTSTQ